MENDNNYPCYQNYSGLDFVSRKGRGRPRRKPNTNRRLNFNNNESVAAEPGTAKTLEPLGYSNAINGISSTCGVENEEDSIRNDVLYSEGREDSNTMTLDHMLVGLQKFEKIELLVNEFPVKVAESSEDKLHNEGELKVETPDPKEQYTLINTRALPNEADTYQLEAFEKNALIIFNQEKIDGHRPRLGTAKDVEALTRTFQKLAFEVTTHNDLTKDEVLKELEMFSEKDFTEYGCVAVAVLTHGSNDGLLRAKDLQYNEIEIINMFKDYNKPTLATKPKLFIIQACRGIKITQGIPVLHSSKVSKGLDELLEPYLLPEEDDLLILHSSYVGSPSHRNELYGSWFIQALCNKIEALSSTHDLESIMTEVKKEVAVERQHEEYNKRTFEMDINKQMPVMTSTLIRKLYLKKFGEPSKETRHVNKVQRPRESRHDVLDTLAPIAPKTPLVQFGFCSCFLDHFSYLRSCLKYFVEENPDDETAQNFLEVANTFEEGVQFNTSKEKMIKAISKHLITNARSSQYYKYLYFHKHSKLPSSLK